MIYVLVFVIGMNVGAAYAAWLLGGWPEVRRLGRRIGEFSKDGR